MSGADETAGVKGFSCASAVCGVGGRGAAGGLKFQLLVPTWEVRYSRRAIFAISLQKTCLMSLELSLSADVT